MKSTSPVVDFYIHYYTKKQLLQNITKSNRLWIKRSLDMQKQFLLVSRLTVSIYLYSITSSGSPLISPVVYSYIFLFCIFPPASYVYTIVWPSSLLSSRIHMLYISLIRLHYHINYNKAGWQFFANLLCFILLFLLLHLLLLPNTDLVFHLILWTRPDLSFPFRFLYFLIVHFLLHFHSI